MNLIDTHAHLYWDSYKTDFEEMIQRTVEAGISVVINIGVDAQTSQKALRLADSLSVNYLKKLQFYSTIGIHPHEAPRFASLTRGKLTDSDVSISQEIDKLEQIYLSGPSKIVGVGECGLDYFFESNPTFTPSSISTDQLKDLQKQLFQAQIDLAKKLNLPLIVHARDDRSKNPGNCECWNEVLKMVGNQSAILHCYSGLSPTTLRLRSGHANLIVSFAANITYPKNEYLREAVKILPLERIFLETDSPFLAPQSKRGQRNEPSAVLEIAQLIADLKGITLKEVASQTTKNALAIFRLRSPSA